MIVCNQREDVIAFLSLPDVIHVYHGLVVQEVYQFPDPVLCFTFTPTNDLVAVCSSQRVFVLCPAQERPPAKKRKSPAAQDGGGIGIGDLQSEFKVVVVQDAQALRLKPTPLAGVTHCLCGAPQGPVAIGLDAGRLVVTCIRLHGDRREGALLQSIECDRLGADEVPSAGAFIGGDGALPPLLHASLFGGGLCARQDLVMVGTTRGRVLAVPLPGAAPPAQGAAPCVARMDGAVLALGQARLQFPTPPSLPPAMRSEGDGHALVYVTSAGDVLLQTAFHHRRYHLPVPVAAAVCRGDALLTVHQNALYHVPLQQHRAHLSAQPLAPAVADAPVLTEDSAADVADVLIPRQCSTGYEEWTAVAAVKGPHGDVVVLGDAAGDLLDLPLADVPACALRVAEIPSAEREVRALLHNIRALDAETQKVRAQKGRVMSDLRQLSAALHMWRTHSNDLPQMLQCTFRVSPPEGVPSTFGADVAFGALDAVSTFDGPLAVLPFQLQVRVRNRTAFDFTCEFWAVTIVCTADALSRSQREPGGPRGLYVEAGATPPLERLLSCTVPLALAAGDQQEWALPLRALEVGQSRWHLTVSLVYTPSEGSPVQFPLRTDTLDMLAMFQVQPMGVSSKVQGKSSATPASSDPLCALLGASNERQFAGTPMCLHQWGQATPSSHSQVLRVHLPAAAVPTQQYGSAWACLLSQTHCNTLREGGAGTHSMGHNMAGGFAEYTHTVVARTPFQEEVICKLSDVRSLPWDLTLESASAGALFVLQIGVLNNVLRLLSLEGEAAGQPSEARVHHALNWLNTCQGVANLQPNKGVRERVSEICSAAYLLSSTAPGDVKKVQMHHYIAQLAELQPLVLSGAISK